MNKCTQTRIKNLLEILTDQELPAVLLYTSGSTGKPKGAIISHRTIIANASSTIPSWNLTQTAQLHFSPMFHPAGIFCLVIPLLMVGGSYRSTISFSAKKALS